MRKGSTHTDDTRAKMSATRKGRSPSDQHRTAIAKALTGKPKSVESNAKRALAMQAYWAEKRTSN